MQCTVTPKGGKGQSQLKPYRETEKGGGESSSRSKGAGTDQTDHMIPEYQKNKKKHAGGKMLIEYHQFTVAEGTSDAAKTLGTENRRDPGEKKATTRPTPTRPETTAESSPTTRGQKPHQEGEGKRGEQPKGTGKTEPGETRNNSHQEVTRPNQGSSAIASGQPLLSYSTQEALA